jgi:acyl-CoA thioester hydrolase
MFSTTVTPRFGDLDVLGHVNNTVFAVWFELARNPFFTIFDPELKLDKKTFPLILAHTEYDFINQIYFKDEIIIKTWVSRLGSKSFTIYHELWQTDRLCAKGSAVIVYFDFNTQKSVEIPEDKRKMLEEHLLPEK